MFLYNTASDHLGCSYEDYPLPAGRGCCPQGYYCNATAAAYATNNVKCVQATWRCSDWTTNASCVEHFCYWITPNADPASHYCSDDIGSCSVYMSNTDCNNDYMDLGIIGYGTDQCLDDTVPIECEGKSFVYNGCACEWDPDKFSPGVGGCDLVQTISSDFFNTTTNYTFACKTFFGMGNCTDGEQAIKWNSTLLERRGSGGMTPAASEFLKQCVGNKTCKSGESMRFCGDEIVKLPGFSFFALISSITLIIVFYIWRKGK